MSGDRAEAVVKALRGEDGLTSPFVGLRLLLPLSEGEERVGGAERRAALPETKAQGGAVSD